MVSFELMSGTEFLSSKSQPAKEKCLTYKVQNLPRAVFEAKLWIIKVHFKYHVKVIVWKRSLEVKFIYRHTL